MVSVTSTSPSLLGTPKKRKRDDLCGKENALRITPTSNLNILDHHDQDAPRYSSTHISSIHNINKIDAKPRQPSFSTKLNTKRRRSTPITTLALSTTSLPNTSFASPHLVASPTFYSPTSAGRPTQPTRCHICFRAQGITLTIRECGVCEKGMCQVCTRKCIVCEEERCSRCCIEEYFSQLKYWFNE